MLKTVYAIGWLAMLSVRLASVKRARQDHGQPAGRGASCPGWEKLFLGLAGLGNTVVPLLYILTRRLDRADCRLPHRPRTALAFAGALLLPPAVWLLWRSHADLGRAWSPVVEVRQEQALVTGGVYRHIRHPMYAAHWLWAIAQALLLQNWIAGPANLATYAPLYFRRVPQEEALMLERFGDDYRAYMARTGRVVPRLW